MKVDYLGSYLKNDLNLKKWITQVFNWKAITRFLSLIISKWNYQYQITVHRLIALVMWVEQPQKWPKKNARQDRDNQENGSLMQILNLQGQFHHDAASPCGEALMYAVKFQKKYFKGFLKKSLKSANPIKVHIFWEGHKILRNLPFTLEYSTYSQK